MKKLLLAILISSIVTACGGESAKSVENVTVSENNSSSDESIVSDATEPSTETEEGDSTDNKPTPPQEEINKNCIAENNCREIDLEVIFELPKKLSDEEKKATILGVDEDKDKIRDDWKRDIVLEYYDQPVLMNLHNANARNERLLSEAYLSGDKSKYKELDQEQTNIIFCAEFLTGKPFENKISKKHADTYERFLHLLERDNAITRELGGLIHMSVDKEVCEKYK